jgi:hypothetical protein
VLALASAGCSLFGGVRVETIASSAQRPSNVAVYVGATEHGEPLGELEAKNFHVYEDGQELDPKQIERVLLPRDAVTHEHVLLLVDLSGNPTTEQRASYARAVEAFVRKLAPTLSVSVRAYDGSPGLKPVGDYPRGASTVAAAALGKLSSRDASRDLRGAVLAGLAELDRGAESASKPVELGTLVVFATGPDLAGRTSEGALDDTLDTTHHDVIGVGLGADTPYLDFARGGVIHAESATTLPIAFEEAGARVAATHAKYYLVAYCSPARAGKRSVRIEVVHEDKKGDEHSGSTEVEIDATGFGPGCRSEATPHFERAGKHDAEDGARVNQSSGKPGAVVPPPATADYAK